MTDAFGIEIQPDILGRPIGPGEIGSPAAVPAADLKYAQAGQGDVPANVLIELDIGTVRFVSLGQLKLCGVLRLEGVIQEVDALGAHPSGEERIPPGPELLAELGADEDLFDESHQDQTPCSTKAFVAAADQPRLATGFAGLGCGTLAYLTSNPSKASRARVSA